MNKKLIFLSLIASILAAPFSVSALTCGATTGGNDRLGIILTNITNAASAVGSALAVIGFIIAGILWLTATGDPKKMETAKTALVAAVIGSAILALAQGANIMTGIFCAIIGT